MPNRAVALRFTSPMRGDTDDEFTDAEGIATFLGYRDGEAKVFIGGHDVGTVTISRLKVQGASGNQPPPFAKTGQKSGPPDLRLEPRALSRAHGKQKARAEARALRKTKS